MKVFCFEGSHGCGKTTLLNELRKAGFAVIDEGFLNWDACGLDPRSLTNQMAWVSDWFRRIAKLAKQQPHINLLFADRSPFTALLYTNHDLAPSLEPLIRAQIQELGTEN
eukprot:TRINITY_DN5773_c1_g1_i1.p1 TRINITY_DN5773_c1_g1~~TRINITY_DN5773_c1_g1_i1.p1  ORF type:complete len:110 (+),score=7.30 TRINITY_DN5773_c1_g1_i1:270-599(+)